MSARFPSIPAAETPSRVVSIQSIGYIQALGLHSLTYNAPKKVLAAQASSLNKEFVDEFEMPECNKDDFYLNFGKMLSDYYGNILGVPGASGETATAAKRKSGEYKQGQVIAKDIVEKVEGSGAAPVHDQPPPTEAAGDVATAAATAIPRRANSTLSSIRAWVPMAIKVSPAPTLAIAASLSFFFRLPESQATAIPSGSSQAASLR